MSTPPLHGLDIETDTATGGLDPTRSRILAVAVASPTGTVVFTDRSEALLLDRLDWHLAALEPGVLVTWHGSGFDLPYLATRAAQLDVPLGLRLALDPELPVRGAPLPGHEGAYRGSWHGHAHLDVHRLYRSDVIPALGISGGLKSVARACGLDPVDEDAARVHELAQAELVAYVASDAECTAELARRRWPSAGRSVDRLPHQLPGQPAGAVTSELLRARARHPSAPRPCGVEAVR